jgi:uncharacterized membrane protein YphA (DoxX/SURF4 family)
MRGGTSSRVLIAGRLGRPSVVLRVLAGGVFLSTGWAKLQDIDDTIRSVRNYQLLPEAIVPTVGSALPVVELIVGVLLVAGVLTRYVSVLTGLLSLAFFIGIVTAWARGLQIQCGCFGNSGFTPDPVPGYVRELVLNVVIMLACAWLFRFGAGRFALDDVLGLSPTTDLTDSLDEDDNRTDAEGVLENEDDAPAGITRSARRTAQRSE